MPSWTVREIEQPNAVVIWLMRVTDLLTQSMVPGLGHQSSDLYLLHTLEHPANPSKGPYRGLKEQPGGPYQGFAP